MFNILEGMPVINGIVDCSDFARGISRATFSLKNNGGWLFDFEVCHHNVKNLINAGDVAEIASLLLVTDCLHAIPYNCDIGELFRLPVIWMSITNMLAWVEVSGKGRANSANAATMGNSHHR